MGAVDEKSKFRKGLTITIVVHALVILLCGLVSCWKQPDPFNVPGEIGVVFGTSTEGSGNNPDKAENPVKDPSEEAQSAPESSPEDASKSITDEDSDLLPEKVTETTSTPKTTPTNTVKPTQNSTETSTPKVNEKSLMGGEEGKGNDDAAGQKGSKNGGKTGMTEGDGGEGQGTGGAPGDGDGLKLDGWKFAEKPYTKEITNTGKATITFTIDRNGKITSCTVESASFSAAEKAIIKEKFISMAKFQKLETNIAQPFYKGTFVWEFKF